MTLRRFAFIPVVVLVAASLAIALAGPARADILNGADTGGRPISVVMIGAAERPGPGDPDGTGTASFTFNPGQGTVCFELTASNIAPATAAHIHLAPPESPGPVVIPLTPPTSGSSSGCISGVDQDLIKAIIKNPENYYVNVHNADFPAGAIRAQLSK
jgi:CHRD domain-containing protein